MSARLNQSRCILNRIWSNIFEMLVTHGSSSPGDVACILRIKIWNLEVQGTKDLPDLHCEIASSYHCTLKPSDIVGIICWWHQFQRSVTTSIVFVLPPLLQARTEELPCLDFGGRSYGSLLHPWCWRVVIRVDHIAMIFHVYIFTDFRSMSS